MINRHVKLFLCTVFAVTTSYSFAQESSLTLSSGNNKVQLIELFTSEGCSSCPPADRWLSGLKNKPGVWTSFVPIAFHVDYWDQLGWKDPYAKSTYSRRQRAHDRQGNVNSVYTPGFVIDGSEWRGYFGKRQLPQKDLRDAGDLTVYLKNTTLVAEYNDPIAASDEDKNNALDLYVAYLGMNLQTNVRRGENSGRTLHHDFVVLSMKKYSGKKGQRLWQKNKLQTPKNTEALAVWVSKSGQLKPTQTVGGMFKLTH